jgi:hypothetical protein
MANGMSWMVGAYRDTRAERGKKSGNGDTWICQVGCEISDLSESKKSCTPQQWTILVRIGLIRSIQK